MDEADIVEIGDELPLEGVGDKLRRAREAEELSLEEMAKRTRIALRHLEMIEQDNFSDLPGRTYAFGFSRTYARELGLDDNRLIGQLRDQLADSGHRRPVYQPGFEPGDPGKVPPPGIIIVSALAVLVLAVGVYAFYARFFAPGADPAPLVAEAGPSSTAETPALAAGAGAAPVAATDAVPSDQVVFTALEEGVWVSFYEAGGRRLEQKLMALGETFVVPAEARDPRIWTGRPDAFAITVGGETVPKLSEDEVVIRDVAITAEALQERSGASGSGGASMGEAGSRPAAATG